MKQISTTSAHKILIVDDTPANLRIIVEFLESQGCLVSVAQEGEEGIDRAEYIRPDLILLDVVMPGMDGFEVCQHLKFRKSTRDIPVIFMTALNDTEHKVTAFQSGAVDYVTKPLQMDEVLARVRTHLKIAEMQKQLTRQNKQLKQEIQERIQAEESLVASHKLIEYQRDELQILYDRVVSEQQVSERLLLNLLPSPIADRLKARPTAIIDNSIDIIADNFPEVTVIFADIVDFSLFSASMSAKSLVTVLNEIFTDFDSIADKRGLEKIKTIGDAYMAAAGLPLPADDHAKRAAQMALDMLDSIENFNSRRGYKLQLRIGINSGPVVAGVIGRRKFIFDLWGDTVNAASRMESQGIPGRVQITDATWRKLGDSFRCEERGIIEAKGLGEMHTWFLMNCCNT